MSDIIEEFLAEFFANGVRMAQDEDGFVTLTDKEGNSYVAQMGKAEKQRYAESGKKLSQVKKEEKEDPKEKEKREELTKLNKNIEKEKKKLNKITEQIKSKKDLLKRLRENHVPGQEFTEDEIIKLNREKSKQEQKISKLESEADDIKKYLNPEKWSNEKIKQEQAGLLRIFKENLKDPNGLFDDEKLAVLKQTLKDKQRHGFTLTSEIKSTLNDLENLVKENKKNPLPKEYRSATKWEASDFQSPNEKELKKVEQDYSIVYQDDKNIYIDCFEGYRNVLEAEMYGYNAQRNRDYINTRRIRNSNFGNPRYWAIPKIYAKTYTNPNSKETRLVSVASAIRDRLQDFEKRAESDAYNFTH